MPRRSNNYSGSMALRGGKNTYSKGVNLGNFVEDRGDPKFFTKVGSSVTNPNYMSTSQLASAGSVGKQPREYGAGLPEGGADIFDRLSHTTAVVPESTGGFPKSLNKSAFTKPSKDDRIEFRTAFKDTKHALVHNRDALDEYRARWTKDSGGGLLAERFETENTVTNAAAVGDVAGQAKLTLRKCPGVPKVMEYVRERIMSRISKQGSGGKGDTVRQLRRMLKIMDDSGNGRLCPEELEWGLSDYGVDLTPTQLEHVVSYLDANGDGSVDIGEFIGGIRGPMSDKRKRLVLQAYAILDKTGDGVVTVEDLAGSYDVSQHPDLLSGKKTQGQILVEFMKQWENGQADGKVTKEEFIEYYDDISCEIENDNYFELMIRNAWHISGGEGAAANTTCRRVLVTHRDGRQSVEEIKNDIGIGPNDIEKMRANLKQQGIDAVKIELYQ